MDEYILTLEQKMTLKAILEGDYTIRRIDFNAYRKASKVRIYVDNKTVDIQPDGKVTQMAEIEVEL